MNISSYMIMALVGGGLLVYFLTPFHDRTVNQPYPLRISEAIANSFKWTTLHAKAVLGLIFVLGSTFAASQSYRQEIDYNENHAIETLPSNFVSEILIGGIAVYVFMIGLRTWKLLRRR